MATPCDLPQLRLWISRIRSDYEELLQRRGIDPSSREIRAYRNTLVSVESTLNESPRGSGRDRVREILAVGIVNYGCTAAEFTEDSLAECVAIDLAVFALWPMVELPKLPANWQSALIEITSLPLTQLVFSARYERSSGYSVTAQEFGRKLAEIEYQPGILNLLHDIIEPRRGGCALTAVALASAGEVSPKKGLSTKNLAKWAFAAAMGGIIGNRADDGLNDTYDWLMEAIRNPRVRRHYVSPTFSEVSQNGAGAHEGIIKTLPHVMISEAEKGVRLLEEGAHLVEESACFIQEGFCLQCAIQRLLPRLERAVRSMVRRLIPTVP
jgi:hypothetical protein